ncbi:MAG: hypothetical protein A3G75_06770 [Verrucomicrobia bacterium RIFCSPLOWO2_12_FULL_64_8]|nr:MAG: hypothetical protein A3G75_06770 [Verrucomicrobia bacterium RIFCSPLOWO2_12_FULL_64_8]
MKSLTGLAGFIAVLPMLSAQTPNPSTPPAAKLTSAVYEWDKMEPKPIPNGMRRALFDGPTTTLDQLHCHITTLNPGERSGEPRKHLQEEVIIIKDGTVEVNYDGHTQSAGAGSVIFFAAGATTFLRNPGKEPATYTVIYYYTPLTPKK